MGLKALRQNSIMCVGMELNGLHPQSCLYAQNTIGEIVGFTDWVSKVLKENTKYPVRSYWSKSVKNLERAMSNDNFYNTRPY
jgi:hypothetical protein